jgi:glutathione S-transferase
VFAGKAEKGPHLAASGGKRHGEDFPGSLLSFPVEAAAARADLPATHPRLQAFLERIHARPAYRTALERGGPYALLTG